MAECTLDATVSTHALVDAVRECQLLLRARADLPRHTCVELGVLDGSLTLRASDQSRLVGLEIEVPDAQASGSGSALVDAAALLRVLSGAPEDAAVSLEIRSGGPLRVLSEPHGLLFRIPLFSHGDERHPWPDESKEVEAEGAFDLHTDLGQILRRAARCASQDEARLNINGIWFEHNGDRGVIVATDGHRLAAQCRQFEFPKLKGIVIPPLVSQVVPLASPLTMRIDESHVHIRGRFRRIWAVRRKVTFPPWRQVIPARFYETPALSCPRADLQQIFGRFASSQDGSAPMSLRVWRKRKLKLAIDTDGLGVDVEHTLPFEFEGETPPSSTISINPRFARDAMEVLGPDSGDRVHIWWTGELDPLIFSDRARRQLLVAMPIRT